MLRALRVFLLVALGLVIGGADGCSGDATPPNVVMDFDRPDDFWSSPFPGEHRRDETGHIDLRSFRRGSVELVDQIRTALEGATGFGTTSAIYFPLNVDVDETLLPTETDPPSATGPLVLVDVDPTSPDVGTLWPISGWFQVDGGPFGAPHLLAMLPVQGMPLRASTLYAAVLTTALHTEAGAPLGRSAAVDLVASGVAPAGMSEAALADFVTAYGALEAAGVDPEGVVALTAFRTQDPTSVMGDALDGVRAAGGEITIDGAWDAPEVFDTYCAYHAVATVPVYQEGEPPYATTGGAWAFDASGALVLQDEAMANVWVTLPRRAMPTDGFPAAVLVRTGAGGDRPLVDRGHHSTPHGESDAPGTGLALEFARAGFAGIQIDGPHGGLRNVTDGDEQFLVFNIQNPEALRDNLRQSALELALLVDLVDTLAIDGSDCPDLSVPLGDGITGIDTRGLALVGHSMGASIAPLAAAFEPRYRALILSGAGGSWLANILYKLEPLPTRTVAENLLRYNSVARHLREDDPVVNLLQWAGEDADAQVYAPLLLRELERGSPRHVLMFQGIYDHYIPPPVANTLTVALGLDLAGTPLDATTPDTAMFTPIESLLGLRGRSTLTLPVRANFGSATTAAVIQIAEDGIEDGHEVMWQTTEARDLVACFLATFRDGTPSIVDPDAALPSTCSR